MPDNSLPKPVPPANQKTKQAANQATKQPAGQATNQVAQATNQPQRKDKKQAAAGQSSAGQMPPSARVKSSQPAQSAQPNKSPQPTQPTQPNQSTQPNQPVQPTPSQPASSQSSQPASSQPAKSVPPQPAKSVPPQPAKSVPPQPAQPTSPKKSLAESPQVGIGQSKKSKSKKSKSKKPNQSGKSDQQKKGHGKKQNKKKKQSKNKAQLAQVKSSPLKYIPYLVGLLVLIGAGFFIWKRFFGSATTSVSEAPAESEQAPAVRKKVPAQQITLNYWGLWEPTNVLSEALADFESQHEGVNVNYSKQSHQDYRERLQTAIASGNGPDVFRYHASWVPMLAEELTSLPQSVMTASEYKQTFYPVATEMLSFNGQIVGLPLMYEGLGLYYNKEMLKAADAEPPKSWAELKTLANELTVKQGSTIKRGGLAIGNASNVEHFADILALLMLQNGADLTAPTSQEAQDALVFYTNFIKQNPVWSDKLPNSTVAFARGDVAMMFAPSWRAHEVMKMNPELEFGITTVPKLGETRLSWASFWAEGVSGKSDNQDMAWKLLEHLSSRDVQQQLYSAQSKIRSFGELYSRRDLADELAGNKMVAPFLEDAAYAQSWYLSSYTHDNGINDLLIKHYEDAISGVLSGAGADEALQAVDQGTRQVLRQYGVSAGSVGSVN